MHLLQVTMQGLTNITKNRQLLASQTSSVVQLLNVQNTHNCTQGTLCNT